jgi:Arc/MetJ family transcription regulator
MRKRTTIWLDDIDRAALTPVRERYGVATDSDALRLALRLLAEASGSKRKQAESKRVNVGPANDERTA